MDLVAEVLLLLPVARATVSGVPLRFPQRQKCKSQESCLIGSHFTPQKASKEVTGRSNKGQDEGNQGHA